jgi:hypothetical protein
VLPIFLEEEESEMPRANHPVDSVLNYFKHASVDAAELTLHVAKGIVKDRKASGDTKEQLVRRPVPKPRKAKVVKPTHEPYVPNTANFPSER